MTPGLRRLQRRVARLEHETAERANRDPIADATEAIYGGGGTDAHIRAFLNQTEDYVRTWVLLDAGYWVGRDRPTVFNDTFGGLQMTSLVLSYPPDEEVPEATRQRFAEERVRPNPYPILVRMRMTPWQIAYWISGWVRGRLVVLYVDTHDELALRREVAELDAEKSAALWSVRKEGNALGRKSRTKPDIGPANE